MVHASNIVKPAAAWKSILNGDLSAQAQAAARSIISDIERRQDAIGERAITDLALVYGTLAHVEQSEGWLQKTDDCLSRVVDQVASGRVPRPGLYGGLCGVGWIVNYLSSLLGADNRDPNLERADAAEDPVASIDDFLVRRLRHGWSAEYDLISGVVGVGVYLLDRLPRPVARQGLLHIVDYLEAGAESTQEGIAWHTPAAILPAWQRERAPNGYYNLGAAHGIPGIVYLLGELALEQIETPRVMRLLEGSVTWLLARRQDGPSQFPSWYMPGAKPEASRLGWCYGSLGVGAVLHTVACRLGRYDWLNAARSVLDSCIAVPDELAHIRDAGLCHGACGVAHIFNRVSHADPLSRYSETAIAWYRRALGMHRPGEGFGGFPAHVGEAGVQAESDASFLAGSFGVALGLLAATTDTDPGWDRLLLLSGRQR